LSLQGSPWGPCVAAEARRDGSRRVRREGGRGRWPRGARCQAARACLAGTKNPAASELPAREEFPESAARCALRLTLEARKPSPRGRCQMKEDALNAGPSSLRSYEGSKAAQVGAAAASASVVRPGLRISYLTPLRTRGKPWPAGVGMNLLPVVGPEGMVGFGDWLSIPAFGTARRSRFHPSGGPTSGVRARDDDAVGEPGQLRGIRKKSSMPRPVSCADQNTSSHPRTLDMPWDLQFGPNLRNYRVAAWDPALPPPRRPPVHGVAHPTHHCPHPPPRT
jgi:hypothetical protein